jgi:uncharacterized protein YndB with AHSA1/START domain
MPDSPVIIEEDFNAPIDKVWRAITDKKEMQSWYFDVSDFKPEPGFEFRFNGGSEEKTFVHLCKIIEVIPEKKLSYSWRFEGFPGNSVLTFELTPEGNKTHLKLIHEGLGTFPDQPEFAKENFMMGWNQIIGSGLKNYLENTAS